jgi:hypothetical protein
MALWLCIFQGPALLENVQIHPGFVPDFFQDYASARNRCEGRHAYSSLAETFPRYLGTTIDLRRSYVLSNAHPPTPVLLAVAVNRQSPALEHSLVYRLKIGETYRAARGICS